MAKLNISDNAKAFFTKSLEEAKASFKMLDLDLDLDTNAEGHLVVKVDNVGFSVKLPGAGLAVNALHAAGVGNLEP